MKKGILVVISILVTTISYSQYIIDANNDTIGFINPAGIIKDGSNTNLAKLLPNGDIQDDQNNPMGSIDGNNFKDPLGEIIGHIDSTNKVFDINNDQIGEIEEGIRVIDANHHVIATASSPVDPKKLAAYFFFYRIFSHGL